jgi:magnesium transporter
VIVDCALYRDGRRQHEGLMELHEAEQVCHLDSDQDGFVWIELFEPRPAELAEVQQRFRVHDLAVEDAQTMHMRPKFEQYEEDDTFFAVLRTATYVDEREEVEFGEVAVFMSRRFLITVRQGAASDLRDARARVQRRPELLALGPAAALWAVTDKIADDYAPVVEGLEHDIEEVETTVFGGSVAATERIYKLRREVTEFYRAVHPLLAPLEALERGAYAQVPDRLIPFFRDVNDHVKLANEEVVGQRDLLSAVLQANIAMISLEQNDISVRQNETTKQLTIIATIFLPLSFISGFFGQNFGWLTNHITSFATFAGVGLGSMVLACVLLYGWFRKSGWLASSR